jgi:hypothetical protein
VGTPDGVSRAVHALRPLHRPAGGRWKYHVPAELDGSPLRRAFIRTLDLAFDTYAR